MTMTEVDWDGLRDVANEARAHAHDLLLEAR